ncbi:MAG: glycolate oxidase iron-sulfur subunit [marine bacterium B5-7]|nr:MAG: glycolate oxidase iron-sulfur subunit [marine bacterium B5-7]
MQTNLVEEFRNTPQGEEAEDILRKCVHCGFCTATCPTYQLLGDELDGPRGRIYQIKQVLEGTEPTNTTRLHLDRCLTCRSCETTCPSGVEYGKLLDIGRLIVEQKTRRPALESFTRLMLDRFLGQPQLARVSFTLARLVRPVLPSSIKAKITPTQKNFEVVTGSHDRRVLMLDGCVQPTLTPRTNQAAKLILDRLGIETVTVAAAGCCGSLSQHLSFANRARQQIRRNIDAWWPHIENGVEALIVTASGCQLMVKDYGHVMKDDSAYAVRAQRVSELVRDLCEFVSDDIEQVNIKPSVSRIAFHAPCTYQHGLKLTGQVERLLQMLGYQLTMVTDAHLCCGSAGTYSVLQAELSGQLLRNKLGNLMAGDPEVIVTANVGCQTYLMTRSGVPVKHWAELVAEDLQVAV